MDMYIDYQRYAALSELHARREFAAVMYNTSSSLPLSTDCIPLNLSPRSRAIDLAPDLALVCDPMHAHD